VQMVMGKDGDLSINDFIVASMNQYRNLSDTVIKTMFRSLDTDGDGWITPQDAFEALQPTGVQLTVKELTKLFDKYGVRRRFGETQFKSGVPPLLECSVSKPRFFLTPLYWMVQPS
jgi:Ca2+-binding EF-hand superfamily protein